MKTKPGFSSCSTKQRCSLGSKAIAAMVCFGLVGAQTVQAQEVFEFPMMAKRGATPPLPAGRGAPPMTLAMGGPAGVAGAAGVANGPLPLRGPSCTGEIRDEMTVNVPVGKSVLVPLMEPARNRTLGNPTIAQAALVSPRTLYVVGMTVGTTNMIVQGKSGGCQMINVIVNIDANGLQQALGQLLPEERGIRVSTAAGNLVLGGHVSSGPAAQQAMQIAQAFADSQPTQQQQAASSNSGNGMSSTSQQSSSASKAATVINMMAVDSPQQVMLEVKVAEVSKTLINQLGSAVNIQGGFGSWAGALVSNLLAGVTSALAVSKANNRPFNLAVDAQKTDNLVKILAEPNLVTISGQEATFLSGGKIFIPIPQSSGNGVSSITLQEEEFGVGLKFTPTVLSGGRISLKVAPEVSELSPTGVAVSASGLSGVSILPLINTRRASTVVQMHDGESFAIGGLLSSNVTGALKAVPGLGEVPVLGALLRSTSFQQDLTELVFIITPHLVKPMQTPNYPLPTDSFSQPNEADVYATGNMEGRHGKYSAAPAGTEPGNAPAPAPVPAPAPQAPAAPVSNALPPHDTQATTSAPAQPAASGNAAPPQKAEPSAQPVVLNPVADEQAARIARIESAAGRIAAREGRQDVANTDASRHALDH
ncbi:type II and III secretion system protein family protein [Paraburkholderia terrae]|uniref:type II and III secretion system protein family protein n=1 Tax=Paraburkholderia terrae TaxID=311230 RepID=UPI0020C02830|nr:type II and III secretion system protein family protein [Paraburkholderia terrae]